MSDTLTVLSPNQTIAALETMLGPADEPNSYEPIFVHGSPGVGKSDIIRYVMTKTGRLCVDIRAVLLDAVDVRGLPHFREGLTHWAPAAFWPQAGCPPTGVFLDELNRAPVLVQNALFQLVLDRKIGEYVLPDNCVVIAAGNRESDGGGVTRMPSALANRFVHLTMEPQLDDWCHWALTHNIEAIVIAFLRFRPQLLHEFDRNSDAFPTPRSWAFVSSVIRQRHSSREIEYALVAGSVGKGAASEFMAFMDLYRQLPNVDAILMDPAKAPVPQDMATVYALSSALAQRANKENLGRVVKYLARLSPEFSVYAMRDATTRDPALTTTKEFTEWAVAYSSYL